MCVSMSSSEMLKGNVMARRVSRASGITVNLADEILRRASVILGTPKNSYFMRRNKH
jgi:hypothetical protein